MILYAATGEPTYPGDTFYDLLTAAASGLGDDAAGAHRGVAGATAGDPDARARGRSRPSAFSRAPSSAPRSRPHLDRWRERELGARVAALFGDELRAEQDRLAAAFPNAPRPEPLAGAGA